MRFPIPLPLVRRAPRPGVSMSLRGLAGGVLATAVLPHRVWAHDAPDRGAEWLMADWMLLAFLVFFIAALIAFVVALRRGLLSNLEGAKYQVLSIDEPDYYTPEWAREEDTSP